ncbi:Alpha helical Porin B [Corynebacterium faecale]|uniref:hypothetical protein n=1 Tax=Corynebacterium faecale TaxID=1758466 RepID=UPI0025B54408|nr:hypothetical protein [Corynebacterium faecale]WJY91709.1 Alpha helical Porin B [Corynebacterium faecale]
MNIRRTLAIAAASVVALSASLSPAQAQTGEVFNELIDNFPCQTLQDGLYLSQLATPDTTRSELAATLRTSANLGDIDPALAIVGGVYAGRIADRALECGAVQPDPQQDILTQLQNLSSNLSS